MTFIYLIWKGILLIHLGNWIVSITGPVSVECVWVFMDVGSTNAVVLSKA